MTEPYNPWSDEPSADEWLTILAQDSEKALAAGLTPADIASASLGKADLMTVAYDYERNDPGLRVDLRGGADAAYRALRDRKAAKDVFDAEEIAARPRGDGPVRLSDYEDEGLPVPTILLREDGLGLLYPGHTHTFAGVSGSGKSFLAQYAVCTVLRRGGTALYLDYESTGAEVKARMKAMGATDAELERCMYWKPDLFPTDPVFEEYVFEEQAYTIAIIDGVTAALQLSGISVDNISLNNDAVARWDQMLPLRLATTTGAAVAMIDHLTKDGNSGGFAFGAMAKRMVLTGALYEVTAKTKFTKDKSGVLHIKAHKDRGGNYDGLCATVTVHVEDGRVYDMTVESTAVEELSPLERAKVLIMRFLFDWMDMEPEPGKTKAWGVSASTIKSHSRVDNNLVPKTRQWLVDNGYVETKSSGQSILHRPVQPYVPKQEFSPAEDEDGGSGV